MEYDLRDLVQDSVTGSVLPENRSEEAEVAARGLTYEICEELSELMCEELSKLIDDEADLNFEAKLDFGGFKAHGFGTSDSEGSEDSSSEDSEDSDEDVDYGEEYDALVVTNHDIVAVKIGSNLRPMKVIKRDAKTLQVKSISEKKDGDEKWTVSEQRAKTVPASSVFGGCISEILPDPSEEGQMLTFNRGMLVRAARVMASMTAREATATAAQAAAAAEASAAAAAGLMVAPPTTRARFTKEVTQNETGALINAQRVGALRESTTARGRGEMDTGGNVCPRYQLQLPNACTPGMGF